MCVKVYASCAFIVVSAIIEDRSCDTARARASMI
jgi:hypothetical protein